MRRYIVFALLVSITLLFGGCGHNMTTNSKGIGIDVSWNGDGYIPNLRLGYWDVAQVTARGNTSYTSNTSTGGSMLGTGGTTQTVQFTTGNQFNQGNVKDVLLSKDVDPKSKQIIASNIYNGKYPKVDPSMTKTISTAGGTGKNPPQVKPELTGTDKIVQTAGDVAKTAAPYVADTVKTTAPVVKDGVVQVSKSAKDAIVQTSQNIQDTATSTTGDIKGIVMWVIIGIVALAIIIVVSVIIILKMKARRIDEKSSSGIGGVVKDAIVNKLKEKVSGEKSYSPYQFFSISNSEGQQNTRFIYNK